MNAITDAILELVVGGIVAFALSKRIPKAIQYCLLAVIFTGIIACMIFFGYMSIALFPNLGVSAICVLSAAILAGYFISIIRKIAKAKRGNL